MSRTIDQGSMRAQTGEGPGTADQDMLHRLATWLADVSAEAGTPATTEDIPVSQLRPTSRPGRRIDAPPLRTAS